MWLILQSSTSSEQWPGFFQHFLMMSIINHFSVLAFRDFAQVHSSLANIGLYGISMDKPEIVSCSNNMVAVMVKYNVHKNLGILR